MIDFLEGKGVANHERLIKDFDVAAGAIIAEEVILEAL
jgi:hypothetical protein